jgi:hypothetical protein
VLFYVFYVYLCFDIVHIYLTLKYSTLSTHTHVLVYIQHIWHSTIYNSAFSSIYVINRNTLSVSLSTTWIRIQYLTNICRWNET